MNKRTKRIIKAITIIIQCFGNTTVPPRSDLIIENLLSIAWSSPLWELVKAKDSCLTQRTDPHPNPGWFKRALWDLELPVGLAKTFSWLFSSPTSSSAQSSFLAFTPRYRSQDTSNNLPSCYPLSQSRLSCKPTGHHVSNYHFTLRLFLSIFCTSFHWILLTFWWS